MATLRWLKCKMISFSCFILYYFVLSESLVSIHFEAHNLFAKVDDNIGFKTVVYLKISIDANICLYFMPIYISICPCSAKSDNFHKIVWWFVKVYLKPDYKEHLFICLCIYKADIVHIWQTILACTHVIPRTFAITLDQSLWPVSILKILLDIDAEKPLPLFHQNQSGWSNQWVLMHQLPPRKLKISKTDALLDWVIAWDFIHFTERKNTLSLLGFWNLSMGECF